MTVVFEGMDGVGKTSTAKEVAEKLVFEFIEDPIKEILNLNDKELKELVKRIRSSANEKIAAVYYSLRHMLGCEENGQNKILDRGMASTYYFEKDKVGNSFFQEINNLGGCNPDLTIVLYADKEERIKRMKKRNNEDSDLSNVEALALGYDKILEYLNIYEVPYIIIDTTKLTFEQTSNLCIYFINLYRKQNIERKSNFRKYINNRFNLLQKRKVRSNIENEKVL